MRWALRVVKTFKTRGSSPSCNVHVSVVDHKQKRNWMSSDEVSSISDLCLTRVTLLSSNAYNFWKLDDINGSQLPRWWDTKRMEGTPAGRVCRTPLHPWMSDMSFHQTVWISGSVDHMCMYMYPWWVTVISYSKEVGSYAGGDLSLPCIYHPQKFLQDTEGIRKTRKSYITACNKFGRLIIYARDFRLHSHPREHQVRNEATASVH